jgi:hypothetical protein
VSGRVAGCRHPPLTAALIAIVRYVSGGRNPAVPGLASQLDANLTASEISDDGGGKQTYKSAGHGHDEPPRCRRAAE